MCRENTLLLINAFFAAILCYFCCHSIPLLSNCANLQVDGFHTVKCNQDVNKVVNDSDDFPAPVYKHPQEATLNASEDAKKDADSSNWVLQNLQLMKQSNLSECMARFYCEERCNETYSGAVKNITDEENNSSDDDLPEEMKYFFDAGNQGSRLGQFGECGQCSKLYPNCTSLQYESTLKTNEIYHDLTSKNISIFDSQADDEIPQHLRLLHDSMEFIELANLTQCYARIGCETTCLNIKTSPVYAAPPEKASFLADDPRKPASVDIIHGGIITGHNFGVSGQCEDCVKYYPDCTQKNYEMAKSSSFNLG